MNYFVKTKVKIRTTVVAMILTCVVLLSLTSCSQATEGESIILELASDANGRSLPTNVVGFSEQDSMVLRCASFVSDEHRIIVRTSKSKDLKATTLVFVNPNQSARTDANYALLAAVPITGKEYEYDLAQDKLFKVMLSSAETAVNTYGIRYADWQVGAVNNSSSFPCCE